MNEENRKLDPFTHGSAWVRADFHLHTRADKEFQYAGEENRFVAEYVEGLKRAGIGLGVITNHNKFDGEEFQGLRKKARREGLFLLPGVELSLAEGYRGLHVLVVFSDAWLEKGHDYIASFLNAMFLGKAPLEYQNEKGGSEKNLSQMVDLLDRMGRDYFLVFPHVEQDKGLWKEVKEGRLGNLLGEGGSSKIVLRTLGFQKVRTHQVENKPCRIEIRKRLGDRYPAEVEGSDCKCIEEIGKGEAGFVKIGAFSFDALKYALLDKENRVASGSPPRYTHSHLRSIRCTGGTLSGQTIRFSPELNTLIGIRGSGKSSILEVLRYALGIPFGEKAGDLKYKEELVGFTLGSGGKIEIDVLDRYGQSYTLRRVWKEPYTEVLIDGTLRPGISIRETVLHKPIYFGQKDLSSTGEGFEKDLVDKLLGSKLDAVRRNIEEQRQKVAETADRLLKVKDVQEQVEEQRKICQDTEYRLQLYADYGIEEKLQKRLDFDNDMRAMEKGIRLSTSFVSDLESLLGQHEDDLRNFQGYRSVHNGDLFGRFYEHYNSCVFFSEQIKEWLRNQGKVQKSLEGCKHDLEGRRKGMVEEFAAMERTLGEELERRGIQNLNSQEFLDLKKRLAATKQLLDMLEKQGGQKKILEDALLEELGELQELRLREFHLVEEELNKVGNRNSSLSIVAEYRGDKGAFLSFMKDLFKGSGIRETTFQKIVDRYADFGAIYKDFAGAKEFFGSNPHIFEDLFMKNLKILLSYLVPHAYKIMYHGKELQHHSLGQRASALMLFVLSQGENDVIIIDQPEDDLDNQTLYDDVICTLKKLKPSVQFIFATHNPNIPVLGDAEMVHACSFEESGVSVLSGSIDEPALQDTIVNVMEGGREAFNRRKEIYQAWKS